ncbi:MAG: hypothetical protein ACI8VC_000709 [Candidatus Endobugula sp.]|jgi:hypothetical protein
MGTTKLTRKILNYNRQLSHYYHTTIPLLSHCYLIVISLLSRDHCNSYLNKKLQTQKGASKMHPRMSYCHCYIPRGLARQQSICEYPNHEHQINELSDYPSSFVPNLKRHPLVFV